MLTVFFTIFSQVHRHIHHNFRLTESRSIEALLGQATRRSEQRIFSNYQRICWSLCRSCLIYHSIFTVRSPIKISSLARRLNCRYHSNCWPSGRACLTWLAILWYTTGVAFDYQTYIRAVFQRRSIPSGSWYCG